MILIAHKFGGSSMADAQTIDRVLELLAVHAAVPQVVVVSAMSGVTNQLYALLDLASSGADFDAPLAQLISRHRQAWQALAPSATPQLAEFERLHGLLGALRTLGEVPERAREYVVGLGEVHSAALLTDALAARGLHATLLDARKVLTVEPTELGAHVQWPLTQQAFDEFIAAHPATLTVVTGYIARLADGRPTTLGRNGSDYSGAIFAALAGADHLNIWTDVDGVLSADPRRVPEAQVLEHLSFREAAELAYFGAKVIHPQTLGPVQQRGIPVYIRNTFNPEHEGTRIDANPGTHRHGVAGFSSAEGLALINLEGSGMVGVPGTAERLFAALAADQVSVVLISQASSEHSISLAVRADQAERAERAIRRAFVREVDAGLIEGVRSHGPVAVLAAVGDGMAGRVGVAAQVFGGLARSSVNIRAIAQGSSERNISLVVDERDATRALRAMHASFYLSPRTVSIGVIGAGTVGAAFLDQLARQAPRLRAERGIDLRVRGIARRRGQWLSEQGFALDGWRALADPAALDLAQFAEHIAAEHYPTSVIVDLTASAEVAKATPGWLARGISVVAANKIAGSAPVAEYAQLISALAQGRGRFLAEGTVGAGLPILSTLRDLIETGDEVTRIEATLSGTLSYLYTELEQGQPFSVLLARARELGFTEPDPRDDLSGLDVARKLVILARTLDRPYDLASVKVENLVPKDLAALSVDEFMRQSTALDAQFGERMASARAAGKTLRHVASLDEHGARVALDEVPLTHPFAVARATDSVVAFHTRRYSSSPLVVQGPGAGPEVTAAGVFADLLRLGGESAR